MADSAVPTIIDIDFISPPKENDIIVLQVNAGKFTIEQISTIVENLTNKFPDNKIIVFPSFGTMDFYSKEELESYIDKIKEYLDE